MPRARKSAKQAGSRFEKLTADYLAKHLDDRIERRVTGGALDRGDIGGVRDSHGNRIVLECKNVTKQALPQWVREAKQEAINDGALVGAVVHKRVGKANPAEQWVTLTLDDFVKLRKGGQK